jgi:hypothetical protein
VYHNFITDDEAEHIIKAAAPQVCELSLRGSCCSSFLRMCSLVCPLDLLLQMKRSTVVGEGNKGVVNNIRTSQGTFLRRNFDPVISAIEKRLASWTHLPESHQEDMQVCGEATQRVNTHLNRGESGCCLTQNSRGLQLLLFP